MSEATQATLTRPSERFSGSRPGFTQTSPLEMGSLSKERDPWAHHSSRALRPQSRLEGWPAAPANTAVTIAANELTSGLLRENNVVRGLLPQYADWVAELWVASGLIQSQSPAIRSLSATLEAILITLSMSISNELAAKIAELLKLEPGWDGDDARRIRADVLVRVVMLLRTIKETHSPLIPPFIAPTFSGSVLLDWTSTNRTLEVQAEGEGWSAVGTVLHRDGRKDYFNTQTEMSDPKILCYYDWFTNELLLWPTE